MNEIKKSWYGFSILLMKKPMKNISNQTKGNVQVGNNKHRPENKDNLDSRMNEEQQFKGDDTTHNRKEHQNQPKGKNKK
jgi:hypothetical protein